MKRFLRKEQSSEEEAGLVLLLMSQDPPGHPRAMLVPTVRHFSLAVLSLSQKLYGDRTSIAVIMFDHKLFCAIKNKKPNEFLLQVS